MNLTELHETTPEKGAASREGRTVGTAGCVLVVDDESAIVNALARILRRAGFEVIPLVDPTKVLTTLGQTKVDVVLTDILMPGVDGLNLCKDIRRSKPDVEVVVMTGAGSIENAVRAIKAGAYDFLAKPFRNNDVITLTLSKAIERKRLLDRTRYLESQVELTCRFEKMIGATEVMKNVFRTIQQVAPAGSSVLVLGESGTGKELVGRAIHERSERHDRPFLAINCMALSETLLESELFGHVKGAFTGAAGFRKGIFEEADGGTLFLDEAGEMPMVTQAKLLRVLQDGEIKRVGSNEIHKVDVRLISATNVDLDASVKKGRFREDLFYRMNVISIALPPLRAHADDIPLLAGHFLRKASKKTGKAISGFCPDAMAALMAYRWPGNIRELENVIERAVVLSTRPTIRLEGLPPNLATFSVPNQEAPSELSYSMPYSKAKRYALATFDQRYLEDVLTRSEGVVSRAARLAHLDRSNLRRLLRRYCMDVGEFRKTSSIPVLSV